MSEKRAKVAEKVKAKGRRESGKVRGKLLTNMRGINRRALNTNKQIRKEGK